MEKLLPISLAPHAYRPVPRFPATIRDLALVVDSETPSRRVQDIFERSPLAAEVTLFDVYAGDQVPQGKKVDLKPLQLRVLRCLFEDPRMPVADIASKTSLTPRRVRRIISQLIEGGGVRFVARINPNAGSGVIYYAILIWDESKTTLTEVEYWVEKEFSGQYYDSYISASAPMMLCLFVVSHLRDAELLSERISHESMIQSIKTIIPFPTKKNVRLQRLKLEQLLQL